MLAETFPGFKQKIIHGVFTEQFRIERIDKLIISEVIEHFADIASDIIRREGEKFSCQLDGLGISTDR
jgi:hypothetical protein